MKEIQIQLKHTATDSPLECTMKVYDEAFYVDNYHFAPIQIHEERYIPVFDKEYCMMISFISNHNREYKKFCNEHGYDKADNKVYDLLRANNKRKFEQKQ